MHVERSESRMQLTPLTRLVTALALSGLLSGFTFTPQHITEAAPVDQAAPFSAQDSSSVPNNSWPTSSSVCR